MCDLVLVLVLALSWFTHAFSCACARSRACVSVVVLVLQCLCLLCTFRMEVKIFWPPWEPSFIDISGRRSILTPTHDKCH